MSFLHPIYLWLLPLAFLPLLLSLIRRINPIRMDFPSNAILEKIIRRQSMIKRNGLMIHEILKVLILFLLILAAAVPFQKARISQVALIDPTLSMSRFDVKQTLKSQIGNINSVHFYLGSNPVRWNEKWDFSRLSRQEFSTADVLQKLSKQYPHAKIILASDGQKSSFKKPLLLSSTNLELIFFSTNTRNAVFEDATVEPQTVISGEPIGLRVQTRNAKGFQIYAKANNRTLLSTNIQKDIEYFPLNFEETGFYRLKLTIQKDQDWKADNTRYLAVLVIPRPSLYLDPSLEVFRPMLESVLVSPLPKSQAKSADISISGKVDLSQKDSTQLRLVLPLKSGDFTRSIKMASGSFPQYQPQLIKSGHIKSIYPVLNQLKEVSWPVIYANMGGRVLLSIKQVPILTESQGIFWLNLDLSRPEWKSGIFPYLLLHEWVRQTLWQRKVVTLKDKSKLLNNTWIDEKGNLSEADWAGIYQSTQDKRFIILNFQNKTSKGFYSKDKILKWLGGRVFTRGTQTTPHFFNQSLIIIILFLIFLDLLVKRFLLPSHP